ncbi:MAG: hypothetical protein QOC89_1600 [Paraburkholderia sp.]|nr:hypothetical protein [Paraburkholderia sp.]
MFRVNVSSLMRRRHFDLIRHYFTGAQAEVSAEQMTRLNDAMKCARADFLKWERPDSWVTRSCDMYTLRHLLSDESYALWTMSDHEVARAVYREVENGMLIVVPPADDLRRYVEAERERGGLPSTVSPPPAPGVFSTITPSELYGRRVPRMSPDTRSYSSGQRRFDAFNAPGSPMPGLLGDASPFEYIEDVVSAATEELAVRTRNPDYAAKMLGYDRKTFGYMLHIYKPRNGLGPADNVIWHDDGSVEFNGKILNDNFHDYAP